MACPAYINVEALCIHYRNLPDPYEITGVFLKHLIAVFILPPSDDRPFRDNFAIVHKEKAVKLSGGRAGMVG